MPIIEVKVNMWEVWDSLIKTVEVWESKLPNIVDLEGTIGDLLEKPIEGIAITGLGEVKAKLIAERDKYTPLNPS